ncbi:MAG: hypothetical protein R2991_00365 [Thermoanaerobaculia bacterium]
MRERPDFLAGLAARRSYFIASAAAAVVLLAGNPLATAVGLAHWSRSGDERKIAVLERSDEVPEVLLLGSSRVKFGLAGSAIEERLSDRLGREIRAYNAALPSSGVLEASWIFDQLVARLGCPKALVADVNVEGVNAASDRLEQGLRLYLPASRWLGVLPQLRDREQLDAVLAGLATGYGHLLYALDYPPGSAAARQEARRAWRCRGSIYGPPEVSCARRGRTSLAQEPETQLRRQLRWYRIRLRTLHQLDSFRLGGLPRQGLEELIASCRRCGTQLVLVTLPTLYPWREWGWEEPVAETARMAQELADARGVRYVDFTPLGEELTLADFYDPGHLSRRGALTLSRRVADLVAEGWH